MQGLGQILGEHVIYSDDGQLLTASFMDYVMPHAHMLPPLDVAHHTAPCTNNPLGVREQVSPGSLAHCRLE